MSGVLGHEQLSLWPWLPQQPCCLLPCHPALLSTPRAGVSTISPGFQRQTYFQEGLDNQLNGQIVRFDGFIRVILL